MTSIFSRTQGSALLLVFASLSLAGCASLMSSAASGLADNLSSAILNQDDPELVREALASYLLLLDSLVAGDPDNPSTLAAAGSARTSSCPTARMRCPT